MRGSSVPPSIDLGPTDVPDRPTLATVLGQHGKGTHETSSGLAPPSPPRRSNIRLPDSRVLCVSPIFPSLPLPGTVFGSISSLRLPPPPFRFSRQ
jgi:hypothetical protein